MPFTLAHPAAVLPLRKLPHNWFSWSALIIGSMAPDFEAILLLNTDKAYGHTIKGMFLLDLPLGMVLWFAFYWVLRDPVLANLPYALRMRLAHFRISKYVVYFRNNFFKILFSLLIGIGSHLLWDSLTHKNKLFPQLAQVTPIDGKYFEYFMLLQYLSSAAGIIIVSIAIYKLPRRKVKLRMRSQPVFWPIVLTVGTLTVLLLSAYSTPAKLQADFYINNILCGCVAGLTVASLLTRYLIKTI